MARLRFLIGFDQYLKAACAALLNGNEVFCSVHNDRKPVDEWWLIEGGMCFSNLGLKNKMLSGKKLDKDDVYMGQKIPTHKFKKPWAHPHAREWVPDPRKIND